MKSRYLPIVGLVLLFLLAATPALADLRFIELRPEGEGWSAVVEGKKLAKKKDELKVLADGVVVPASAEVDGKNRLRLTIDAPADIARLELALDGRKGAKVEAGVTVAPGQRDFGDWTVYHVMMGYYRNGDSSNDGAVEGWRHVNWAGGDLQGVIEKADHIADMGFDAVWLSPLFQSRTSHGYDVQNYYRPGDQYAVAGDPEASLALFRKAVTTLQEKGVRVILDLPLNHAHRSYDREAGDPGKRGPRMTGARQEAEKTWDSWGASFGYWNIEHEPTRQFLTDVALHYLVDEGVDGLRLDYVRGVSHEYWSELYAAVKAKKPGAWLLGECWIDGSGAEANAAEIARYYAPVEGKPQFDSLVDFPMQIVATDVFARGGSLEQVEKWLQESEAVYGPDAEPAFFLDNHDMSRFLSWTDDPDRLVAALGFFATLSNPMIVFYGTETGLANSGAQPGFIDTGRLPIPWDALDTALMARIRGALEARKAHPALHGGGRLPLQVDDDTLVMAKIADGEIALVGVNLADEARTITLDRGSLPATGWQGVLGAEPEVGTEDGKIVWELPPISTSVAVVPR
jgi:glycosidase